MEYVINEHQHTYFAHIIPYLILFFLLLRSFGLEAKVLRENHFKEGKIPLVVIDYTLFNERALWLQYNKKTGTIDICYRRLGLAKEWFDSTDIISLPARPLSKEEVEKLPVSKDAFCFTPKNAHGLDKMILCQEPEGILRYIPVSNNNNTTEKRLKFQNKAR